MSHGKNLGASMGLCADDANSNGGQSNLGFVKWINQRYRYIITVRWLSICSEHKPNKNHRQPSQNSIDIVSIGSYIHPYTIEFHGSTSSPLSHRSITLPLQKNPDLTGKTFVITGTTSGTGKVAAHTIASKSGRVMMLNRPSSRSDKAQQDISAAYPNADIQTIECIYNPSHPYKYR